MWVCAAAFYREALTSIVTDAVTNYRRKPGLDSLTRIYEQDVGAIAFAVLERALPHANVPRTDSSYPRPAAIAVSRELSRAQTPCR